MPRNCRFFSGLSASLLFALLLSIAGCGGSHATLNAPAQPEALAQDTGQQTGPSAESYVQSGMPRTPPADARRPWETLDGAGHVQPDGSAVRGSSSINAQTVFAAGVQRDSAYGSVADLGEASALSSGNSGQRQSAFSVYRLAMTGQEPGVVAVDANLHAISGGSEQSQYYVALSDYTHGVWDWRGPFSDGQIRLAPQTGSSYLSPLGNLYVTVAVYNGAAVDVVGVGANGKDGADTTAPPAPGGLTATPIAGGLELQWNDVLASDLVGYRIYYSKSSITNLASAAVKRVAYLEGTTRYALTGITGATFVRVTAVDITGNESAVSNQGSDTPLPGSVPQLRVSTDIASGTAGASATLSVSGASSYDADLNGDGVFEITGSAATTYQVDTSQTGLLRPRIRATGSGTAVAYGGVSLIIAANFPPVAKLTVAPKGGTLWGGDQLNVTFDSSGSTDDGGAAGLQYAYDPEGDGSFGSFTGGTSAPRFYSTAGTYLGAVQVKDSAGLIGYAYAVCTVKAASGFTSTVVDPGAFNVGFYPSCVMINGCPAISFENVQSHGLRYVRALDPQGHNWAKTVVLADSTGGSVFSALAEIGGFPAVVYYDANAGALKYRHATTSTGNQAADWLPALTASLSLAPGGDRLALLDVAGRPALAWVITSNSTAYYKRAIGSGDQQTDWSGSALEISTEAAGDINLFMVSGKPAAAWRYGQLLAYYKRSSTATGDAVDSWAAAPIVLNGIGGVLTGVSGAVINGHPAVAYNADYGSFAELDYVRATTSTGDAQADWPVASTISPMSGYSIVSPVLIDVDGLPGVAFGGPWNGGGQQLYFTRAQDPDGSVWNDVQAACNLDPSLLPGTNNCLVATPGWLGIANCSGTNPALLSFSSLDLK